MMKKQKQLSILLFAILATCLLTSTPVRGWTLDYFVIQDQAEPFQIQTAGKDHRGIISDILSRILDDSSHDITTYTYPFNRMIAEMRKKEQDDWITFGSPVWGELQSVNLSSVPILTVEHSLLSGASSSFDFKQPEDLDGKIAVLLLGFDYPGLDKLIESGSLNEVRVKNYESAFNVLKRLTNIAGFIEMDLRIRYHLKKQGLNAEAFKLKNFGSVIPDYNIHLAYSPGIQPEIKQFIDKRLIQMREDGEIQQIVNSYL